MLEELLNAVTGWAAADPRIEAALLVGSCARGTQTADSDVDLVLITPDKARLVASPDFVRQFGAVERMQTEYYGKCTSVRVWYDNGPEVEFGLVEPSWLDLPLDSGTRRVLCDGYRMLHDRKQYGLLCARETGQNGQIQI